MCIGRNRPGQRVVSDNCLVQSRKERQVLNKLCDANLPIRVLRDWLARPRKVSAAYRVKLLHNCSHDFEVHCKMDAIRACQQDLKLCPIETPVVVTVHDAEHVLLQLRHLKKHMNLP